jgi:hypothetical protein
LWIGGSPCAGKSSIAGLLAARQGWTHFECDAGTEPRLARMKGQGLLAYERLTGLTTCERLARSPRWQVDREVEFYHEQFDFLLDELPTGCPVLAEGADLLPELLHRIGVPMDRAVWIVPTPEFQVRHYAARPWVKPYLAGCPDPAAAFDSWMRRDMLFARYVRSAAEAVGGRVIVVDGSEPVTENVRLVAQHFDLRPPEIVGG